jgi:hypothetical protein
MSKLPRRHAQRQALCSTRNAAPRHGIASKSDSDLDLDSGYSSHSNPEAEARYYDQMMDKFEKEGPTLSNPVESTRDMMEKEKRNWQE